MDQRIKVEADRIFGTAPLEIMRLYTRYALLMNAFDVTRQQYQARATVVLSTTLNIPAPLRLPIEMDVQLHRDELLEEYGNTLLTDFCQGFLVTLISKMDAWIEDVFEFALPILLPQLTTQEVERRVRSAWAGNQGTPEIRRCYIDDLRLLALPGRFSTPQMLFDRYEEMRELRHAIVHSDGRLEIKHATKLQLLRTRFPPNPPGGGVPVSDILLPNGIAVGNLVTVGPAQLLRLRRWAFDALAYFRESFAIS